MLDRQQKFEAAERTLRDALAVTDKLVGPRKCRLRQGAEPDR